MSNDTNFQKNNVICLTVTNDELNDAIARLESGETRYFYIAKNLFTLKNINTCFNPYIEVGETGSPRVSYFKFSYDDGIIRSLIKIAYRHESTSVYQFLIDTNLIERSIVEEMHKTILQKYNEAYQTANHYTEANQFISIYDYVNEVFYNEVIIYLTSHINKEDSAFVKDDFETKYAQFKASKIEKNIFGKQCITKLYEKIVELKFNSNGDK